MIVEKEVEEATAAEKYTGKKVSKEDEEEKK